MGPLAGHLMASWTERLSPNVTKSGSDVVRQRTGVAGGIYRLLGLSGRPPASFCISLVVSVRGKC